MLKKRSGLAIEKVLPVPKIELGRIPECQKYLVEGRHRMLYTNGPSDCRRWRASGATAKPRCRVTRQGSSRWSRVSDGGSIPDLNGLASALAPEYAPEEMFEVAQKLYAASR